MKEFFRQPVKQHYVILYNINYLTVEIAYFNNISLYLPDNFPDKPNAYKNEIFQHIHNIYKLYSKVLLQRHKNKYK